MIVFWIKVIFALALTALSVAMVALTVKMLQAIPIGEIPLATWMIAGGIVGAVIAAFAIILWGDW